jgi:endonuclease YncB( thermonuclease family)
LWLYADEDGVMQLAARPPPVAAPALLLLVTVIGLGLARPAPAAEPEILAGAAAVIDGDTFRIGETVVRLYDVDAPELAQTCAGGPARLAPCGAYVADALAERLAGREVRCEVLKLDQYDRRVARCEVEGEGLSQWLVASGLAMVFRRYSDRFIEEEDATREAGVGLWLTDFEPPWEYRAKRWEVPHNKLPTDARSKATSTATVNASIIRPGARSGTTEPGSVPPGVSNGSVLSARPLTPAGALRCDSAGRGLATR